MEKRFCRRLMFGGENSVQLVEMIICRLTQSQLHLLQALIM